MHTWIDSIYRTAPAGLGASNAREVAWLLEAGGLSLGTDNCLEVGQLLPSRPPGAQDCRLCDGTGFIRRGIVGPGVVCPECGGLGWKVP